MQLIDLYMVMDDNVRICLYKNNILHCCSFNQCPEYLLDEIVKKVYISTIRQHHYITAEL